MTVTPRASALAKNIDHIHRPLDIAQGSDNRALEQALARMARVDRHHVKALQAQIPRHIIAGPHGVHRHPHNGDPLGTGQDRFQQRVRIAHPRTDKSQRREKTAPPCVGSIKQIFQFVHHLFDGPFHPTLYLPEPRGSAPSGFGVSGLSLAGSLAGSLPRLEAARRGLVAYRRGLRPCHRQPFEAAQRRAAATTAQLMTPTAQHQHRFGAAMTTGRYLLRIGHNAPFCLRV